MAQAAQAEQQPDLLTTLVSYFEEYEQQSHSARALNERDRDYTDHKQLTDDERRQLAARKQPPTQNNRIRKKINFLRGYERQIRTDPRAYPRTPQHEDDAESITDALRYVADNAQFDVTRSAFWDNYIIEGTGACEVIVSKDEEKEIQLPHIQWDRLFWDYHSRKCDFSDARYTGIIIWDDVDNILAQFPNSKDIIQSSFNHSSDDTYEDKPTNWVDSKRKRLRIAQIYHKLDGVWHLSFFIKAGFLTKSAPSPWLDEKGNPENGMIMQSAYVDREGNRFGEPRFMIEQQDAINKRESKTLHLLSQRQTWGNERAFPDGPGQAKTELAKPDGHVIIGGGGVFGQDFGILQNGDMAQGQFQLLQEAKQEIDASSSGQGFLGQDQSNQSGRAIIAQQTGSQIEINPLADGKRQWELRVYRACWNRIKQFWKEERWIRVTDDENNARFVGLNRPVKVEEAIADELGGEIPPEFANDPRLQMVSRVENQVSELDVDIIIEDSPDIVTIQQEAMDNLISLAQVGITFEKEDYIAASQLRNKSEMLKRIKGEDEAQQQQLAQQAQAAQQLQQEVVIAEVEKDGADALNKQAQAQKNMADAERITVETDQMRAGLR